jgi:hypothetical protein
MHRRSQIAAVSVYYTRPYAATASTDAKLTNSALYFVCFEIRVRVYVRARTYYTARLCIDVDMLITTNLNTSFRVGVCSRVTVKSLRLRVLEALLFWSWP